MIRLLMAGLLLVSVNAVADTQVTNTFQYGQIIEAEKFNKNFDDLEAAIDNVLIGAAATVAEYNGVERASHIKDKLVEMTHLNETIYSTGIAASYQASKTRSGAYLADEMLALWAAPQI